MQQIQVHVVENRPVKSGYYLLRLHTPEVAQAAQPGQFVHLRIPGLEPARLRRPFSIYNAEPETGMLTILYKVVGYGTRVLQDVCKDTSISVLGPIGKGFPLAPEGVPLLVGGGYGVAPLYFLATRLPEKGILFVGGRTAADILETRRFLELGWEVYVATQDGSEGEKGLVTHPLDRVLTGFETAGRRAELYACGPDGMLKAVGDRAIVAGYKAWLSLDKHMVCAVGACLACIQKLQKEDGTQWVGRVCKDGPVFESREIVWSV